MSGSTELGNVKRVVLQDERAVGEWQWRQGIPIPSELVAEDQASVGDVIWMSTRSYQTNVSGMTPKVGEIDN